MDKDYLRYNDASLAYRELQGKKNRWYHYLLAQLRLQYHIIQLKRMLRRMIGNEGSYIIHRQDGKIVVSSTEEDIAEGTMVWMEETPPEETK